METVLLIFFATLSLSFGIAYLAVFSQLKKSNILAAELFIKNKALEEINNQLQQQDFSSDAETHKENFIKFLSDSRDWAFEYIEKSQTTIKEVSKELEKNGLKIYSDKLSSLLPDINEKDNK